MRTGERSDIPKLGQRQMFSDSSNIGDLCFHAIPHLCSGPHGDGSMKHFARVTPKHLNIKHQ